MNMENNPYDSMLSSTPQVQQTDPHNVIMSNTWDTGLFVALVVSAVILVSVFSLCVHRLTRCEPTTRRKNPRHLWYRMHGLK